MTVFLFYAGVNAAGLSEIGLSTSSVVEGGFSKEASNPKITRALLFVETDPETHDRLTHPAPLRFANDPLLATHCFCAARVTGTDTWRIYHFQETSDNPDTGIWTFVAGASSLQTAGPSGTPNAWDRDGVAYPVLYYDVPTDTFFAFVAGLNATDGAGTIGWQIGLYTFPSSDITNWTKHPSSPILGASLTPIPVIYTNQVGPALVVSSTVGFSAEAIVIVRQNDSNTHGISRIREVVSATALELYHEMPNLNLGDPVRAVAQVGPGMSMHPTYVEKLEDGTFRMRATAFEPFRKGLGGNGLFEVQCTLTAPALTGPWIMDHQQSILSVPPNIWTADRVQSDLSFAGVESGTPINVPIAFEGSSSVTIVVQSIPPGSGVEVPVSMTLVGTSTVEFNLWKSGDNCVDKIDLFNTTLITLGLQPLKSLSENTSNRRILDAGFKHFRRKFLRDHYYNGATKTVELTAATDVTTPEKWDVAYDLPLDYLRAVIVNGYAEGSTGEPWAIEVAQNVLKRVLFLHGTPARLEYVFDVGEALCLLDDQTTFAMAVAYAHHVARSLGKDADDIQEVKETAIREMEDAKGSDGQEGTPRRFAPSPLVRSRRPGTARHVTGPNRFGIGWPW